METPDPNGFISVNWPSTNVPHGGIFHTPIVEPSSSQQEFLKVLLEESRISIAQRQKGALGLRQPDEKQSNCHHQARPTLVRPRTSRRRSLSAIKASGIFDSDLYRPLKRGEDREQMKEKLANTMAYGDNEEQTMPQPLLVTKPVPKLPNCKERWNELLTQIRERTEWLAEMEYLGQAEQHREIINDQIAVRMRALDALGVDSECSSARSTATGFSTIRSTEKMQERTQRSNASTKRPEGSNQSAKRQEKKTVRVSRRSDKKEENVLAYGLLTPLQYSPRRRV